MIYRWSSRNNRGEFVSNSDPGVFVGPPTKPEGPLVVENVTKDQATLKWKEPKDNGGNPVRFVLIYTRSSVSDFRKVPEHLLSVFLCSILTFS